MRAVDFTPQPELLDEVAMNPANLRRLAAETGALAGMEFEMIVPDVANPDPDEGQMEPDYGADERIRNFGNIENFFLGGDGVNSRRQVEELIQEMRETYSEWLGDKQGEDWNKAENKVITDLVEMKYIEELEDRALKEIEDESGEFGVGTEEFKEAYNERLAELVQEKVDEIIEERGSEWDEVYEEWLDEWEGPSEEEWMNEEGMHTMADIERTYEGMVYWPYYGSGDGGGSTDISTVTAEFEEAIGKNVKYSTRYHGAQRDRNSYIIEPDSSLSPDNSDDMGLEFVSPPMPVDQMLSDLRKVRSWAKEKGCYTNDSTGLHMNVSVPDFSRQKCDYVKLALLLGDEYVSSQFGRLGNTYAKSAMDKIRSRVRLAPQNIPDLLEKMRSGLSDTAMKVVHSGATDKYTSINMHDGYVEFRSPGGDWLDADLSKLENTLLRFVVALDAACDPQKYRKEYLKKLYLLFKPQTNNDPLAVFAQYSAGYIPKDKLISALRTAQTQRIASKHVPGAKYWYMVYKNGKGQSGAAMEVVATNKDEAITKAAKEWGLASPEYIPAATAEVVKPYTQTQQQAAPAGPNTFEIFSIGNPTRSLMRFQSPGIEGSTAVRQAFRNALSKLGATSEMKYSYRRV